MIEFTFRVILKYRDALAFIDESLDRAQERQAEALTETILADPSFHAVLVQVDIEPI